MKPIIRVENLSKRFRLGEHKASHLTLRDSLTKTLRRPFESLRRIGGGNGGGDRNGKNSAAQTFWALRDVNFEIQPGETVGIIGRNGAGKSTLLKILSRIVEPTAGRIELYGRVSSLLEVGTGFHPELTGRENIFLNGAILGMRRDEIARKFDEIVAFAEIEQFIDTAVKFYSSGMYVRLAFAVAAHLEPEILIVDEVLAVGDAEFQKKCLGKMDEVSKAGRTVLFVSHQMGTVAQLCQKTILLERGAVAMHDRTEKVIERYVNHGKERTSFYAAAPPPPLLLLPPEEREMSIESARVSNVQSIEQSSFRHDEAIRVRLVCRARQIVRYSELRMVVKDGRDVTVFTADAELGALFGDDAPVPQAFAVDYVVPPETLRPGNFSLTFALFVPHQRIIELVEDAVSFSVYDAGTKYARSEGMDYGVVFSPCEISLARLD